MKRIFLLLLIIPVFIIQANAQMRWGIKGGIAASNRSGFKDIGLDECPLPGLQTSFFNIVPLGKLIILQSSLGYYAKGNQFKNIMFTDQAGNDLGTGTLAIRFDYIELALPFQYRMNLSDKILAFSGLGPYIAYAIGGVVKPKNVSDPSSGGGPPQKQKIVFGDNGSKRVDAGLTLLISVMMQKYWMISLNYDQGVVKINSGGGIRTHNLSGGLTVGYLFK